MIKHANHLLSFSNSSSYSLQVIKVLGLEHLVMELRSKDHNTIFSVTKGLYVVIKIAYSIFFKVVVAI